MAAEEKNKKKKKINKKKKKVGKPIGDPVGTGCPNYTRVQHLHVSNLMTVTGHED